MIPPGERIEFCRAAHGRNENRVKEMLDEDDDVWFSNFDFPQALKQIISEQI